MSSPFEPYQAGSGGTPMNGWGQNQVNQLDSSRINYGAGPEGPSVEPITTPPAQMPFLRANAGDGYAAPFAAAPSPYVPTNPYVEANPYTEPNPYAETNPFRTSTQPTYNTARNSTSTVEDSGGQLDAVRTADASEDNALRTREPRVKKGQVSVDENGYYSLVLPIEVEEMGMCIERYEDGPFNKFAYGIRTALVDDQGWAYRRGIESKDILVQINGTDARGLSTAQAEMKIFDERPSMLTFQSHRFLTVLEDCESAMEAKMEEEEAEEDAHLEAHFEEAMGKYVPDLTKHLPDQDDIYYKSFYLSPGVLKMFPSAFLLFCVAIFIVPVYLVIYASISIHSRHFFPDFLPWLLVIPAIYALAYVAQTLKGGPSKFWVVLSLIGTGVVLLVVSDLLLIDVYEKGPAFSASQDCGTWGEKRKLQEAWDIAATWYTNCLNKSAQNKDQWPQYHPGPYQQWTWAGWQARQNLNFAAASAATRIQDCPGYEEQLHQPFGLSSDGATLNDYWSYLKYLEVYQHCSGWCKYAPALWSDEKTSEPCSVIVATILEGQIAWALKQATFYTVFAMTAISMILLSIPPMFKRYGIPW